MKYYFQPPGGSYEVSRMFHCTVPAPQLPIFSKRGPQLFTHHELLIALTHLVSQILSEQSISLTYINHGQEDRYWY